MMKPALSRPAFCLALTVELLGCSCETGDMPPPGRPVADARDAEAPGALPDAAESGAQAGSTADAANGDAPAGRAAAPGADLTDASEPPLSEPRPSEPRPSEPRPSAEPRPGEPPASKPPLSLQTVKAQTPPVKKQGSVAVTVIADEEDVDPLAAETPNGGDASLRDAGLGSPEAPDGATPVDAGDVDDGPYIDPRRSLVVTDLRILRHFPFEGPGGVLQRLLTTAKDTSQQPQDLLDNWGAGPDECPEKFRTGTFNGFPVDCRDSMVRAEAYKAIGLANRFDLASAGGRDCGEYRLAFNAIASNPDGNSLSFDARLPNPTPSMGLEGCRPVVEFWNHLTLIEDVEERAALLRDFYFNGLGGGFPAVIDVAHYAGEEQASGQIRLNQTGGGFRSRSFYEFRTAIEAGRLQIPRATLKENAYWDLSSDTSLYPQRSAEFKQAVLAALEVPGEGLLANSRAAWSLDLPASTETGSRGASDRTYYSESIIIGLAAKPGETYIRSGVDVAEAENGLTRDIQTQLDVVESRLTPQEVLQRVEKLSCRGCHGYTEYALFQKSWRTEFSGSGLRLEAEDYAQSHNFEPQATAGGEGGAHILLESDQRLVFANLPLPLSFTGKYAIALRYASGSTDSPQIQVESLSDPPVVFETPSGHTLWRSGWNVWKTAEVHPILPPGTNGFAIRVTDADLLLDWIEIRGDSAERYPIGTRMSETLLPERLQHMQDFLRGCVDCDAGSN